MPRTGPDSSLYLSPEWLALRDQCLARDGQCCRNCGLGDRLEVHHWLPLPQYRDQVDRLGYSLGEHPLLVELSGLVTLCADCHATLTAIRQTRAVLGDAELPKLSAPGKARHNVFELWALGGKQLPFRIRKSSWNPQVDQYYRVERVEIGKWPYGKAWGVYVREGVEAAPGPVPNAGIYSWFLVEQS